MTTPTPQGLTFDRAAARYAANRPSYPPELLDAIEESTGRPLRGARVADVGAGTGLGTGLLHGRGAHVVAVEPGPGMAREFRHRLPDVPLVLGDGNRLPLATGSLDLLTYAQAWHWTDPERSVPEARRVLRSGGALALWWNDSDDTVPWIAEQTARLIHLFDKSGGTGPDPQARFRRLPAGVRFTTRQLYWSRHVPLDGHLANLSSFSDFLVLGEERTAAFLAAERALLAAAFPSGTVEERYIVSLAVARP